MKTKYFTHHSAESSYWTKMLVMFVYSLFCTVSLMAQIEFAQVPPALPAPQNIANFDAGHTSSIAFTNAEKNDVQQFLMNGLLNSNQHMVESNFNDFSETFSLVNGTPFDQVQNGSIAFADVDGDGDPDVLITGINSFNQRIAKLYTNDGNGNFSLVSGTPFDGVESSSIAFADVDGDGDPDVLISGSHILNQSITKLYTNDGSGNFSLVTGTPFDAVYLGSIAFADVDGDGDQDVLITGYKGSSQIIAKLYTNDGSGNFSLVDGTPFHGVQHSSIAFADVDGDGDLDVLITGLSGSYQNSARLYTNDGNGNFSLESGTPFEGVYLSSIAFADVDGDGDPDVLITGLSSLNQRTAKLYTNDGSGNFSLVSGTPFDGVWLSSIAFADVDGDGDPDVLITGQNTANIRIAKLYTNDGSGNFSLVSGTPFEAVTQGSIAFADVDGDGDQDVLITGLNQAFKRNAKLYRNLSTTCLITTSCSPFTLTLSALGVGNLSPGDLDDGSSVSCGFPALSLSQTHFTNANLGENMVTLTVTEANGNSETCITTVTVANPCPSSGGILTVPPNRSFCVGTGTPISVDVTAVGAFGTNQRWALIDEQGNIVETRSANSLFNLDVYPPGDYTIRYIRYEDDVTNIGSITHISQINILEGCFGLASNSVKVYLRSEPEGGTLSALSSPTICSNAGELSKVQIELTGSSGDWSGFGVIDLDDNNRIVAQQIGTNINFNSLPPGNYRIYHLAYNSGMNLSNLEYPQDLDGCYSASNGINVTVVVCDGIPSLSSQPNPTTGISQVTFTLPETGPATLEVYDMNGRLVRALFNAAAEEGILYRFEFDGSYLPNGVYLYRLTTDSDVVVEKFMLSR